MAEETKVANIKVIDALNYPFNTEAVRHKVAPEEVQMMLAQLFKTVVQDVAKDYVGKTPQEFVADMDALGYDKVIIAGLKMWSYRNNRMAWDFTVEQVYEIVKDYPDRLIGAASYNPWRIEESIRDIDRSAKEWGFKYVFFHPASFNLPINDRRFYPIYAKCVELDVTVGMQVGHSAELFPSEPGRPIYVEDVALNFPNLRIILSHAGWPWTEEFIAMVWKFPNVYGDIAAHRPRRLEPSLLRFIDTRGRDKMLFATNGIDLRMPKEEAMELNIRDEAKVKFMRENAIRAFKL